MSPTSFAIIGDSQACAARFWAREIAKRDGVKIHELCRGGTQTRAWGSWLTKGAGPGPIGTTSFPALQALNTLTPRPEVVIVYLGSNDGATPDANPVIDAIRANGARTVWVGPPLIRGAKVGNEFLKAAVAARGETYLDTQAMALPLADGVHGTIPTVKAWLDAAYALAKRQEPGPAPTIAPGLAPVEGMPLWWLLLPVGAMAVATAYHYRKPLRTHVLDVALAKVGTLTRNSSSVRRRR